MTVNIVDMAVRYLSQADIARLLGVDRTLVNVWRSRFPDFPEPDVETGANRPIPGWRVERMDEIRAWLDGHGLGGQRERKENAQ